MVLFCGEDNWEKCCFEREMLEEDAFGPDERALCDSEC